MRMCTYASRIEYSPKIEKILDAMCMCARVWRSVCGCVKPKGLRGEGSVVRVFRERKWKKGYFREIK